jgi:hypothetical protein
MGSGFTIEEEVFCGEFTGLSGKSMILCCSSIKILALFSDIFNHPFVWFLIVRPFAISESGVQVSVYYYRNLSKIQYNPTFFGLLQISTA